MSSVTDSVIGASSSPPSATKSAPAETPDYSKLWLLDEIPVDAAWAAKRRLAAALRTLAGHVVETEASEAVLIAMSLEAEAQVARLAALPHRRFSDSLRDGTAHENPSLFADRQPIIGLSNPVSPPLRVYAEGEIAVGEVNFGVAFEGVPTMAHGGLVAAVFDQVFGFLMLVHRIPCLTGSLTVKYRRPTPLHKLLRCEARLSRTEGRKNFLTASLLDGDVVTATAESLFIRIEPDWVDGVVAKPES